jgi:hypothetical protein
MTFEKTEISTLPGIGAIDYGYNNDHELIAQHNYMIYPRDISFRGWYDPTIMNTCASIVAVWHIKKRKQLA